MSNPFKLSRNWIKLQLNMQSQAKPKSENIQIPGVNRTHVVGGNSYECDTI